MISFFSAASTILQGLIVLLGGFVTLAYSFSVLRQPLQRKGVIDWSDLAMRMTINLCLLGLYGGFVYIFAVEEMSDGGFRALTELLGG
jgi:hypothetical protein